MHFWKQQGSMMFLDLQGDYSKCLHQNTEVFLKNSLLCLGITMSKLSKERMFKFCEKENNSEIYTQTKVKQHHIFSKTLFLKLQNGICG